MGASGLELPRLASRLAARELQDPAASRALRATAAFMVPLVLAALGLITGTQAILAAFAGHTIGGMDVRGAYALRLSLLLSITLVLTGSAWLGALAGSSLVLAVAGTGLIALGAGAWRHGLGEYGPAVAGSAALLFFLSLASPRAEVTPFLAAQATLAGGLGCLLLHAAFWPFLAQHPLRRAVAGSWTALADLAAALPPVDGVAAFRRQEQVAACEHGLRAALDQAAQALAGVRGRNSRPLIRELEALNRAAADLATQVTALNPSLERLMRPPGPGPLAASFRSVLNALVNTSRSLALAVVSHQAGHLGRFEVRLLRLGDLLRLLRERTARLDSSPEGAHLDGVLAELQHQLPRVRAALRAAMERAAERGPISFELFDLETWSLRPLAAALNFSLAIDPALVRFTFRLAAMMMAGTCAWRFWHLPHGYWIPLCVMVVLQPDYGATRARATQRALGTICGGLAGSLLLWLHLGLWPLLAATAATCWAFTYYLKRDYAIAVFYITLLVVLQFEAAGPVTVTLTLQRLGLTLAGCVMALLAALSFWPVWERDRFPPLLAAAVRANRVLLERLCRSLAQVPGTRSVIQAKREAQRANSLVFSSLNRMAGDPRLHQEGIERSAALANHNLRITRWLSVAAVHCAPGAPPMAGLEPMAQASGAALETLAAVLEGADPGTLAPARAGLEAAALPDAAEPRSAWVTAQLEQAATELSAMLGSSLHSPS